MLATQSRSAAAAASSRVHAPAALAPAVLPSAALSSDARSSESEALPPDLSAGERLTVVRSRVRELLERSDSFRELPPEKQREIARNTVEIVNYICAPEGIQGDQLRRLNAGAPAAAALAGETGRRRRGEEEMPKFSAQGAREGAEVAGLLLQQVNFPEFVRGLIDGVFNSIVESSIRQMEAYGNLVKSVAQTLNQFRDENVSMNQGRDHLVEQFPDTFMIDVDTGDGFEEGRGPRVRLRDGVDERAALEKVNSLPLEGGPLTSLDLEDEVTETKLVQAARTQLATSRQQLLATMVLMGINRIVVTDGRISAKVMYDFRAQDNFKYRRSATQFDYDPTLKKRTSEGEYESDYQGAERDYSYSKEEGSSGSRRDASYYSKGMYKYSEEPVMTLASASQAATDAALQTKAQLAGSVEVNFKSETFPLEKMADSFQISQIQNASRPRSTAQAAPPAGAAPAPAPAAPAPATSPAPVPA